MMAGLTAMIVAASAVLTLTPDGLGAVRIGMTRAEVEAAIGNALEGEPVDEGMTCVEMVPAGPEQGLWFMFEDSKLTRISIGEPSKVKTELGIGVGTSADAVRSAYGPALLAEPHHYGELPAEYLTFWTEPDKRGLRFETDARRKVQTIHAGNSAIEYVEGCL